MDKNVLVLAYIGDAVYEIYIRKFLIEKGISKVDLLQKNSTNYVSAKSQSKYVKEMIDLNFVSEDEKSIVLRARNHKGNRHPKNTDIITYKWATGLEALIGYLFLENKIDRINEIMDYIVKE